MSSIGQSILMALTVTVNKYASSNVQSVHRKRKSDTSSDFGRRGIFLSTVVAALQATDSRTELLNSNFPTISIYLYIYLSYFYHSHSKLSNVFRVSEEDRGKQSQKRQGGDDKCLLITIGHSVIHVLISEVWYLLRGLIVVILWKWQRLDSYYKRNYKDYFEAVEGTLRRSDGELSDAEKDISKWLEKNK